MQARNRAWIKMLSVAAMLIGSAGSAQVGNAAGPSSLAEGVRRGSAVQHRPAASANAARLREDMRKLWSDHVFWTREIAVDLIAAAKANDQANYTGTDQRWKKNGEEIADFLSQANPNWPKATLASMMAVHLATTTKEAVAWLNKKWDEDAAAFDDVYSHILHVSDALSDGIIKQFPQKF